MGILDGWSFLAVMMLLRLCFVKRWRVAFSVTITFFMAAVLIMGIGNTYDQRKFYGPERVARLDAIFAFPKMSLGSAGSPAVLLRATLEEDGSYSCKGVTPVTDGFTTMSLQDNDNGESEVFCCRHDVKQDGYLAPFKKENGKLHLLCGTFPFHNEVTIDAPEQFNDFDSL